MHKYQLESKSKKHSGEAFDPPNLHVPGPETHPSSLCYSQCNCFGLRLDMEQLKHKMSRLAQNEVRSLGSFNMMLLTVLF